MAIARKVKFSQAIVDKICDRMVNAPKSKDRSLRAICRAAGMPHKDTFLGWVDKLPEVRAQYEQAILDRQERFAEEVIEIADSGRDPAKVRNQMHARQWTLACMNPKKYGNRVQQEISGVDGGPIKSEAIVNVEAGEAYLRMLNGRS